MDGLLRTVAADGAALRLAGPLVAMVWSYLSRLRHRVAARIAAGPRPSRPRTSSAARTSAASSRLPRRRAWLRSLIPGTAGAGAQLAHLLAEPDMAALIAADPALGRTIRPLCRLLGIRPPPSLEPPRRPRRDKAPPGPSHPAPARRRASPVATAWLRPQAVATPRGWIIAPEPAAAGPPTPRRRRPAPS